MLEVGLFRLPEVVERLAFTAHAYRDFRLREVQLDD
jgi:hypothetical protein